MKAFHNEKKQQFDISKVPDIYDSAKYDAIHNSELGLNLKQLYTVSSDLRSSQKVGVNVKQLYSVSSDLRSSQKASHIRITLLF